MCSTTEAMCSARLGRNTRLGTAATTAVYGWVLHFAQAAAKIMAKHSGRQKNPFHAKPRFGVAVVNDERPTQREAAESVPVPDAAASGHFLFSTL